MKPRTGSTLRDFAEKQQAKTCSRLAGEHCGKDGPMGCACGRDSDLKPNRSLMNPLDDFGRERLSKHYFMRDFLYSEIAAAHRIPNLPDDAELAVRAGKALCRNLLEPLRRVFGHVTIRSAFRSASVNGFGNCQGMECSSNKASYANHIWDHQDSDGFMGATACIVIPWFVDWMNEKNGRDWRVLAWFIHDHLPYSEMVFYPQNAAVNLTWRGDPGDWAQSGEVRLFDGSCNSVVWRSEPRRRIDSFQEPAGLLIKNGEPKEGRGQNEHYGDCLHQLSGANPALPDYLKQLSEAKRKEDERFEGLVQEWKDEGKLGITFDKWRSGHVLAVKGAWQAADRGTAPFQKKERWYRRRTKTAGS